MGTSFFAVPILKSLYQNGYPISAVYTQPPKKSKRIMSVNPTPIQSLSETFNLEIRTPSSLKNNKEEYEYLKIFLELFARKQQQQLYLVTIL